MKHRQFKAWLHKERNIPPKQKSNLHARLDHKFINWSKKKQAKQIVDSARNCLDYEFTKFMNCTHVYKHVQNYTRIAVGLDEFYKKYHDGKSLLEPVREKYEQSSDFPDFRMAIVYGLIKFTQLFMDSFCISVSDFSLKKTVGWSIQLLYMDYRLFDPHDITDTFARDNYHFYLRPYKTPDY